MPVPAAVSDDANDTAGGRFDDRGTVPMNADLDVLVSAGSYDSPSAVADVAVRAEELGFSHVSMGETTGWNIVPLLTLIADRTERIGVTDDVVSPFGRSPALLAQTALTLHDVSDGRFRLGLGPSSPAITERWHGLPFERPLRRLRETIDVIRAVYAEGNPAYEGEVFDIPGLGYERDVPDDPPPIDLATLGSKSTELAGRFADGWVPQLFGREGLRERLSDLERGAGLGGRDPEALRVSPVVRCFAAEDRDRAREALRSQVAFMAGAYGPFYGDSMAEQGYADAVETTREAWADRDTDAMAEAVSDEMLDTFAAAGTPEEVQAWVEAYADVEGVDAVRVGFVRGMSAEDKENTMAALSELL